MKKGNIFILGGSGFIGSALSQELSQRGYRVSVAGVKAPQVLHKDIRFIGYEPSTDFFRKAVEGNDFLVNLAGASIGRRWGRGYRELIYSSRVDVTRSLVEACASLESTPKALINASAVGYYGTSSDIRTEDDSAGNDFLSRLGYDWEREAMKASSLGMRVALIRTANVLGRGGLVGSITPLFRRGLGGFFGSGQQIMPWIHIDDIVGIYIHAIENSLEGPYNASAGLVSQKQMFCDVAEYVNSPFCWRIPGWAARVALGGFAEALLSGQSVSNELIIKSGYNFKYKDNHREALDSIFKEKA